MTRSIFDPAGPDTERSGSRYLGPDASNLSHLPSSVTDGEVSEEEKQDAVAAGQANPESPTADTGDDTAKIAEAERDVQAEGKTNPLGMAK